MDQHNQSTVPGEDSSSQNTGLRHSVFGIRRKLRSGYNKRFGVSTSNEDHRVHSEDSINRNGLNDESQKPSNETYEHTNSMEKREVTSANMEHPLPDSKVKTNASLYMLRRNNSRQSSRSNSIVNNLYLNNINSSGIFNSNSIQLNTSVNNQVPADVHTPTMGPMTPVMTATPNLSNYHKYQNSVTSFSSFDGDNCNGGVCTPVTTKTGGLYSVYSNNNDSSYNVGTSNNSSANIAAKTHIYPIELTNEFRNVFIQEYEKYCLNPKVTPFDQGNPPPGVIEIVFKKCKYYMKLQKFCICKNNKNKLNLDNNDSLYRILKDLVTDKNRTVNGSGRGGATGSEVLKRNMSRNDSISSFQLDMTQLKYSNLSFDFSQNGEFTPLGDGEYNEYRERAHTFSLPEPSNITTVEERHIEADKINSNERILGTKLDVNLENKQQNFKFQNSGSTSASSNPILFSPRKLKREQRTYNNDQDAFLHNKILVHDSEDQIDSPENEFQVDIVMDDLSTEGSSILSLEEIDMNQENSQYSYASSKSKPENKAEYSSVNQNMFFSNNIDIQNKESRLLAPETVDNEERLNTKADISNNINKDNIIDSIDKGNKNTTSQRVLQGSIRSNDKTTKQKSDHRAKQIVLKEAPEIGKKK